MLHLFFFVHEFSNIFIAFLFRVRDTCDRWEIDASAEQQHQQQHSGHRTSSTRKNHKDFDFTTDSSSSSSSSDLDIGSVPSTYKLELKRQNAFSNNLCITGIPQIRDENLRAIFLKLCKLLGAKISDGDIRSIRRDFPRSVITVEFWTHNVKMHISRCSHSNYIWTDEVIRLPPGIIRNRIFINDQMTKLYKTMWEIARDARKKNIIQTSWITEHGYMVKRTQTSQKRYFLSPRDLTNYINQIQNSNKRNLKRSVSQTSDFGSSKHRRSHHGR